MATRDKEIYLVEDSADFRHLVRAIFSEFLPDYKIRFFQGGEELYRFMVLQSAENFGGRSPGLVIMDLGLPSISGFEMINLLRRTPSNQITAWQAIPIIVLSNSDRQADIDRCYKMGANSFFVKPLEFEGLRDLLETICRYWMDYNLLAHPHKASNQGDFGPGIIAG